MSFPIFADYKIDTTLTNKLKAEYFMEHFDDIPLDKLEGIVKKSATSEDEEYRELNDEIEELKRDIRDLEREESDMYSDIDEFDEEDVQIQFYENNKIEPSIFNHRKAEMFFKNFNKFTLEQFEGFLKPFNPL